MCAFAQAQARAAHSSHNDVFHRDQVDGDVTRNSDGQSEDVLAPQQLIDHKLQAEHCPQIMLPQQLMDGIGLLPHSWTAPIYYKRIKRKIFEHLLTLVSEYRLVVWLLRFETPFFHAIGG